MAKYKVQIIINTKKVLVKNVEAANSVEATSSALINIRDSEWRILEVTKTQTKKQ